jgi:hypothetical protein
MNLPSASICLRNVAADALRQHSDLFNAARNQKSTLRNGNFPLAASYRLSRRGLKDVSSAPTVLDALTMELGQQTK